MADAGTCGIREHPAAYHPLKLAFGVHTGWGPTLVLRMEPHICHSTHLVESGQGMSFFTSLGLEPHNSPCSSVVPHGCVSQIKAAVWIAETSVNTSFESESNPVSSPQSQTSGACADDLCFLADPQISGLSD